MENKDRKFVFQNAHLKFTDECLEVFTKEGFELIQEKLKNELDRTLKDAKIEEDGDRRS